jgi:hypothetical protein
MGGLQPGEEFGGGLFTLLMQLPEVELKQSIPASCPCKTVYHDALCFEMVWRLIASSMSGSLLQHQ